MAKKLIARITDAGGANPIIMDQADSIEEFEAINSSEEGGSFNLPANDPKIANVDYTKWWEIWDAGENVRLNYGPIHTINEGNETWTVGGPGRSQLLEDLIMTKHTFYYPINRMLDDLRYENIAAEPRTATYVYGYANQPDTSNSKFYGLSKKTGVNAIDDTEVFTISDKRLPTFHTTDSYWSGTDRADGITINLGQRLDISRVSLLFPWWGGYKRFTDRTYDFDLSYSNDMHNFTNVVTKDPNYIVTGDRYGGFFFYFHPSGYSDNFGFEPLAERVEDDSINSQYWRVNISDTHAWYGNILTGVAPTDRWADQCTPPLVGSGHEPGSINSKALEPANDCHASLVEIGAYTEVIGRDTISNLVYQQIDNSSNQVTYTHTYGVEEAEKKTVTTLDGRTLTRYEPGTFFKRIRFSWAGAGSAFTRFYTDDPAHSMTSSVMAVVDQNNSLVYRSSLTSGTKDLILPAYTQFIQIKGATGVQILTTDAWLGETNPFSVDNSIATSVHVNDTATLHFRGTSLKMFITTPVGKQGGKVKLQLRTKNESTGFFGSFVTLVDQLQLPNSTANYKMFEITEQSGLLRPNTSYEFRVTNQGGFVGLDAFAGYWEASWIDFNEDHERVLYNDNASAWLQLYDGRFSGGTMTKTKEFGAHMQFGFTGDRVQLFMCKGPNFGKATIYFSGAGSYGTNVVTIPTIGTSIVVDLGKEDPYDPSSSSITHYVPRYLAFDSHDYWPNGMPWATYNLHVRLLETDTYTTKKNLASQTLFDQECIDCDSEKNVTINKSIYIDGVSAHCTSGLSAKFNNETHLSILKSVSEAIQHEWEITEAGLNVVPRIGIDTNYIIRESSQAVITHDIVNDVSKVATLLYANGAAIDGAPLFTITEDRANREIMDRTIARTADYSSVADYFSLIGLSRLELKKRQTPEQRISLTYVGELPIEKGDSFILVTNRRPEGMRVRLIKITQQQSFDSGITYSLECEKWPAVQDGHDASATFTPGGGSPVPVPPVVDPPIPDDVPSGEDPPGTMRAQFPGTGPNTEAAFVTMMGDLDIDVIEMATGTYTGWSIGNTSPKFLLNRTASHPLLVRPAQNATVIWDGTGVGGDGLFYFGDFASGGGAFVTDYITFDSIGTGGTFNITNYALDSQGLINTFWADHITINRMNVTNCTSNVGGFLSWCVYASSDGTHRGTNLTFDNWNVQGDGTYGGYQGFHDPQAQNVNVRNWTVDSIKVAFLSWGNGSGVVMSGWNGTNCYRPISTDGNSAGIASNNTFSGSANAADIQAPFVDGGGNTWG